MQKKNHVKKKKRKKNYNIEGVNFSFGVKIVNN